jgi:hypothetical protein
MNLGEFRDWKREFMHDMIDSLRDLVTRSVGNSETSVLFVRSGSVSQDHTPLEIGSCMLTKVISLP